MTALPHSVRGTASLGTHLPIDANQEIHFAVVFNVDTEGLQGFVNQVSDPNSPLYREFLTPGEVGARFGASQADVDSTVSFLQQNGFTVTMLPKNHTAVFATGTVAQVEQAFGTKMTSVQEPDGRVFHTNLTAVNVPSSLANKIHSIRGLDTARRMIQRASTTTMTPPLWRFASHDNLAYNGGYYGQGHNIAIANWDGFRLNNLSLFYATWGLPLPPGTQPYTLPAAGQPYTPPAANQIPQNVKIVPVDNVKGWVGYGTGNPQGEGDLDQQNVLMSAPLSNLYVYDDNVKDDAAPLSTYTQIAEDNVADVVTESYGWATYYLQWTYDAATSSYTQVNGGYFGADSTEDHMEHLVLSAQGITYMAATGDSGTAEFAHQFTPTGSSKSTSTVSEASFGYPDIDSEVLMIGGEVVTITTPNGPVTNEAPWTKNNANVPGGTGGFDLYDTPTWDSPTAPAGGNFPYLTYDSPSDAFTFNTAPTYQTKFIPQFVNTNNFRSVPDVVAPAGGGEGFGGGPAYVIFWNKGNASDPLGTTRGLWGTSCSSPAVAGALGVLEERVFLNVIPSASRSNVRLGRIADYLYARGSNYLIFNDITAGGGVGVIPGTSISANPQKGWDYATGWGSLDFQGLYLSFFTGGKGIGTGK